MGNAVPGPYKVGVFVDVANVYSNGGSKMRYDVLRSYAEIRGTVQRLNAYVSFDNERAKTDYDYADGVCGFHEALRDLGFQTIIKEVKWYSDPDGHRVGKANADVQMAVDMIMQGQHYDLVILVSGDGDFVPVVQSLRNMGVRVEAIGFENVSQSLRKEVDAFINGFLIPELIPTNNRQGDLNWGEMGATVRGTCYFHNNAKGYGFFSYLKEMSAATWITDPRTPGSPFGAAFFHDCNLPPNINPAGLPNRRQVFEFELGQNSEGIIATNIRLSSIRNDIYIPADEDAGF